ncbi:MAG: sialate O-acetylesterase [Aureliella sp.]
MNLKNMSGSALGLLGLVFVVLHGIACGGEPAKVFILAGQSNMQGHAQIRTMVAMGKDAETESLYRELVNPNGEPKEAESVWISSVGSSSEVKVGRLTVGFGAEARGPKIGPEYSFGFEMQKLYPNSPIVLIKTAWGGKSLHTDFRPPSARPYEFSAGQKERFEKQGKDLEEQRASKQQATGVYYRAMMEHVHDSLGKLARICPEYDDDEGYELAGFVWFQGWNDMVDSGTYPDRGQPGSYDSYTDLLRLFVADVRKELSTPDLPFVVGVMGVGGSMRWMPPRIQKIHGAFRDAMAAAAEDDDFVVAVHTADFWDESYAALKPKDEEINRELKELEKAGELARKDRASEQERRRRETFSEEEYELLTESVSNAEYHYLGSAKIMTQIGKAFAKALNDLQKRN